MNLSVTFVILCKRLKAVRDLNKNVSLTTLN